MNERMFILDENLDKRKPIRMGKWILSITIPPILFLCLTKILFTIIYDFVNLNLVSIEGIRLNLNHIIMAFLYLIPILIYFRIADARRYKKGMIILGAIINILLFSLLDIFEMYYYGAASGWKALGGFMIILETVVPNLLVSSIFCIGAYALMKSKMKTFLFMFLLGIAIIVYYF